MESLVNSLTDAFSLCGVQQLYEGFAYSMTFMSQIISLVDIIQQEFDFKLWQSQTL